MSRVVSRTVFFSTPTPIPPRSTLFPYTTLFRSHADFTYHAKYGYRTPIGGGRASVRETIGRVAAGALAAQILRDEFGTEIDRKSTRLNSSHVRISYAVFCLKKKKTTQRPRLWQY